MSRISDAIVPSVGTDGLVGRFIGGCSGTFKFLCSVFEHLKQLWMGIWQHTHTFTTTEVSPDLGEFAEIIDIDDVSVEMSPLRYC